MILCPMCGNKNQDDAIICAKCRINLQSAIAKSEKLKAQCQDEEDSKKK